LSIVAKGAFECAARIRQRLRSTVDHPKRTGDNAVAASVANVILHEDGTDFRSNDRPSRARLQATSFFAVFADIGDEDPAKRIFRLRISDGGLRIGRQPHLAGNLISFLPVLLEEHDMAPRRRSEVTRVIVRVPGPGKAVVWHLVPFFACDFAGFATNANARVGEEPDFHVIVHIGVPALVSALDALADHINGVMKYGLIECWGEGVAMRRDSSLHHGKAPVSSRRSS
jgi:hypothetical protein